MQPSLRLFVLDDRGQGLVEYALIIALVAITAVTALRYLGAANNASLSNSNLRLSS